MVPVTDETEAQLHSPPLIAARRVRASLPMHLPAEWYRDTGLINLCSPSQRLLLFHINRPGVAVTHFW